MKCNYCNAEMDAAATHCPGCGRIKDLPDTPLWRVVVISIFVVLVIAAVGYLAFRRAQTYAARTPYDFPGRTAPPVQLSIEHGPVISATALTGHGKLYFVPIGRQSIDIKDLAAHYDSKFKLKPMILPQLKPTASDCPEERKQCAAQQLIFAMVRAYPQIAADPDSVMIAITDEDIYDEADDDDDGDYVHSFHFRRHFGIVSSYREGLDNNNKPLDAPQKLAGTEQVLTKYIAYMYYHVPYSHDPTSLMHQPYMPNGGPDDLYESDLHSEYSANGMWGNDGPCFGFHYSYKTGFMSAISDSVLPCTDMDKSVRSTDDETFQTEIFSGLFKDRAMDLYQQASPAIEFRRGYVTRYPSDEAFGLGTNVSYNRWATSDGVEKLTFVDLIHEDGLREHFSRDSPGKGFSPDVKFIGGDNDMEAYGAKMIWDQGQFRINYLDGSVSTILPCDKNAHCYWSGYQDPQGHVLKIQRDANRQLQAVESSDHKKVECSSEYGRIKMAKDSAGRVVKYEYDNAGRLVKVHRPDGQTAVYGYDRDHNMTTFSVIKSPGAAPKLLLTNEYDAGGRIIKQTLADSRFVTIAYTYGVTASKYRSVATDLKGTSVEVLPEGHENGFIAKARPLKYRAVLHKTVAKKE